MTRGGKPHGRFPLVAPLFPSKPAKNAAHAKTQDAKKQNAEKTHATTKTRNNAAPNAAAQNAGRNARKKPAHYPKSCFYPPNGVPQLITR